MSMKYFFILAMGRSGTNFLASLLTGAEGALVYHEPVAEDLKYFGLRYAGQFNKVMDGYLEKRFQMLLKNIPQEYSVYGEINSYLRYEVDWLKKELNPVLIHLVRDGRDFVRSAYIRDAYTNDERNVTIVPRDQDSIAEKWEDMDRFQKLCWYWKHTNDFISSKVEQTVHFEKILTDYDYFKKNILEPIGLNISNQNWEKEVGKPKNTSRKKMLKQNVKRAAFFWKTNPAIEAIPHWSRWDARRIKQFDDICSKTMKRFGYY
jgi:hypothetical protein